MSRVVIAILGTLVSAAAASPAGQREAPLIVAYNTADGELVPVARFDGRSWRNTWPDPIPDDVPLPVRNISEIPRAWLGQPVPLTWTAWSRATGKYHNLRVTGIERDGACVEAITLATSPELAPADGLAFNRPTTVDALVELGQGSPESDRLRRAVAPHFRTAINSPERPQPGVEHRETGAQVLALARADSFADEDVAMEAAFQDPRSRVFFIEASRQLKQIPTDTHDDALSYRGWFRSQGAGALIPINAAVTTFSTAEGKLPRYEPVGILRLGTGAVWVMSEWGIESQTIVLFEISAKGVRKLTSAEIGGC